MSDATPEQLATEAKQPGVFNIIDVLNNRGYPKDDVEIVLDDNLVYAAAKLDESVKELDKKLDFDPENADLIQARESLIALRDEAIKTISDSKYIFTITGISEGKREEMLNEVEAIFPTKYEETTNPLTGKVNREEISDPERNKLYSAKLWAAHIEKIVSPDGNVQKEISESDAEALRNLMPIAASAKISESIERLRVASAMFIFGADENFLAKS
jgi:hypothetical protein